MTLTNTQAQIARTTFVGFAVRAKMMTESQARYEFDEFLMAAPRKPRLKDSYITTRRIGAAFTVNRAKRLEIFQTFENAINHATF